jgi:hypothetical protein
LAAASVSREEGEEFVKEIGVEAEVGGELPEERAEFGVEPEDTGGEEVRQGGADLAQFAHVGDEARALDGEDEVGGGGGSPLLVMGGALEGVEAAVELDGGKLGGGEGEFLALGELWRVEGAAPGGISPAGDADADVTGGAAGRAHG